MWSMMASSGGAQQRSMVSARWMTKEATGVSRRVGARVVAGCGLQRRGRTAKLNGDDTGGGNGHGIRQEIKMRRVREYGKYRVKV